jgi:glycosyl transferase family 25
MEEFKKIDLDSFQIVRGIDGMKIKMDATDKTKGEVGCLKSHLSVISDAIDKNYDKIAVFEDDVIFCDDFQERFEYYIKNVPDDWEIMYLGNNIPVMLNPISMVSQMIYRVWKSKGCFAMILNNKNGLFQKILDISKGEDKTIDSYIESLFPYIKAYTFLPFFVKISDIKSDISNDDLYSTINRHYKEKVTIPIIHQPQKSIEKQVIKTQKEMCEEHLKLKGNFVIYFNNNLIFDSSTSSKDNVLFFNEHFEVFGRQFPYRGMFIKRK